MTGRNCRVLLISGSLRRGSTNTAVLRTAAAAAPPGTTIDLYDGLDRLPPFNPDDDAEPLSPAVADLRARIDAADAVLFSTPEYAGALPGSLKNLLDWTVGDADSSGTPVGWVNASTSPTGAAGAHRELRIVVEYTDWRVVDRACAHIPVPRAAVGDDGEVSDPAVRARIAEVMSALVGDSADRSEPAS